MVEMLVGVMVLIPVVLFLIDIGVLVLANIINGDLAKNVARAAANAPDGTTAQKAAENVVGRAAKSGVITQAQLGYLYWRSTTPTADTKTGTAPDGIAEPLPGQVQAVTTVTVKAPVPFPFLPAQHQFSANATQPIVGISPNLPGSQGP